MDGYWITQQIPTATNTVGIWTIFDIITFQNILLAANKQPIIVESKKDTIIVIRKYTMLKRLLKPCMQYMWSIVLVCLKNLIR